MFKIDILRQVINKEKLIFVSNQWHSPSECLWGVDSISDQVSIPTFYADLKSFFVTRLHVKNLTVTMLVSDLSKRATARTLKYEDAKSLIFKINTMLATEVIDYRLQAKFDELANSKCFPVKKQDGTLTLQSTSEDFATVDHARFGQAFRQKADLFDFDLDDVQRLRRFLEATNLTNSYLSSLVEEVSEVTGTSAESSKLTAHFRGLGYALFW